MVRRHDRRPLWILATFYFLAVTIVIANVLVFWTPIGAVER